MPFVVSLSMSSVYSRELRLQGKKRFKVDHFTKSVFPSTSQYFSFQGHMPMSGGSSSSQHAIASTLGQNVHLETFPVY